MARKTQADWSDNPATPDEESHRMALVLADIHTYMSPEERPVAVQRWRQLLVDDQSRQLFDQLCAFFSEEGNEWQTLAKNRRLVRDLEDIRKGKMTHPMDLDPSIGEKSRRVVREQCEVILRGEIPPLEFLQFIATGMIDYLDEKHSTLESALKLKGRGTHGASSVSPDVEADAITAYLLAFDQDPSDIGAEARHSRALDAAYERLHGAFPEWHRTNPDKNGDPTHRTIRDRLKRIEKLIIDYQNDRNTMTVED